MMIRSVGILVVLAGLGMAQVAHGQSKYASVGKHTELPAGYTACALDNKTCAVPSGATVSVYYGADTRYVELTGTGSFTCGLQALGLKDDPASGVAKTCWIKRTDGAAITGPISPLIPAD